VDPSLEVSGASAGRFSALALEEGGRRLVARMRRAFVFAVSGPPERVGLLYKLVRASGLREVEEVMRLELPADPAALADAVARHEREARQLLTEGRLLVEAVERIVCGLYRLAEVVTDEVVAHAAARAERGRNLTGSETEELVAL
jgi:hypothetical protein